MREHQVTMLVPASFELPDLDGVIAGATLGEVEEPLIEDTYHDTPDLRLARWGCTLRQRSGEGWKAKIPRASRGIVLDRQEVAFSGEPDAPQRLDGPAAFAAVQIAQQLVVEARTHDTRWRTAHRSMTKHTAWFS